VTVSYKDSCACDGCVARLNLDDRMVIAFGPSCPKSKSEVRMNHHDEVFKGAQVFLILKLGGVLGFQEAKKKT
jgi:hypothetical protein